MLKSIWWTTPFLFPRWRSRSSFRVAAADVRSLCYQRQFVDGKAFLDMRDDNLPKLVVCASLYPHAGVTYERVRRWFVRQSEADFL